MATKDDILKARPQPQQAAATGATTQQPQPPAAGEAGEQRPFHPAVSGH